MRAPKVVLGAGLAAAAVAGCASAASQTATAADRTAMPAGHTATAHLVAWSVNSDGPGLRAILTGMVGDYGPAVADRADGSADSGSASALELNLSRGSFALTTATIDSRLAQALKDWRYDRATCSVHVTASGPAPVVSGSGTGAYRGISGAFTLTITIDEVDERKPGCSGQLVNGQPAFLSQLVLVAGAGSSVSATSPEPVLHRAYSWARGHPLGSDSLLGGALLACSSGQFGVLSPGAAAATLAVSVLLALAVALRRRITVAAFALAAVIGVAQAILGFRASGEPPVHALRPTMTDTAIVVLLYTLAVYRPRRVSLAGLVVCVAGSAIAVSRWTYGQRSATVFLLAIAALTATFLATWVLGDSAGYRRAYYRSLEERLSAAERTRDLEEKRAAAVEQSAVRLRRIERDLHDGAQVRLTMLAMALGEIKETMARDPGTALALVSDAHQAAKDTLAELRDLARGIHPAVLDHGLRAALWNLAENSAIPAVLTADLTLRPSPAIESIVYFSAAELLANAAKHSGADHVTVAIRDHRQGILLIVTDDGTGGARITAGGGLAGLRERVQTIDGHLSLHSPVGGPTTVTIELPGRA